MSSCKDPWEYSPWPAEVAVHTGLDTHLHLHSLGNWENILFCAGQIFVFGYSVEGGIIKVGKKKL